MKSLYAYVASIIILLAMASCSKNEWSPIPIEGYELKSSESMIDYMPQTVTIEIEKANFEGLSVYDQFSFYCETLVRYDGQDYFEPSGNPDEQIPWCHISEVEQDGKKVIKLDFEANDTDEMRGVRVSISSPANDESVAYYYGFCDVYQLPEEDVDSQKIKP